MSLLADQTEFAWNFISPPATHGKPAVAKISIFPLKASDVMLASLRGKDKIIVDRTLMPPSSITAMRRTNSAPQLSQDTVLRDTIAKARSAIERRDTHAAIRDLSAHLNNQRVFHEAILSLLDSSPSPMRQELIKEVLSQCPHFDLNAHNKEGKTVLDLAMRQDDQEFARYLLVLGAKPDHASLGTAFNEMKTMVTSQRRKNLLYAHFNERNRQSWTSLDRTLHTGRYKEARTQLEDVMAKEKVSEDKVRKVWEKAMHACQRDILRALLVAGTPDELRELSKDKYLAGQWEEALHDDPGLSAVLKEFPYQSVKRGKPEDFNGEAIFPGTNKKIFCRHLATYQQEVQSKDPHIKFDYDQFSSSKSIENNVKPGIEKTYKTLKAQASETHLIRNKNFGHFLASQFEEMEKDGKQSKLMLVISTNHATNLGLRIKEKNGKKSYVVKFFDPNDTTTGTRSKTNSMKTFETQTLDSYITDADYMNIYYPELVGRSMIFVRPQDDAQASISPDSSIGRTLTSMDIKDNKGNENIDATVIWLLMSEGFAGNLRQLHGHFSALPEDERIALLAAADADGDPGIFIAMQDGHADTVKAYGELLKQFESIIPEDQLIKLLSATDSDGTPALFMSMHEGHAETVKAYGELLKQFESMIPEDQLIKLLAATDSKGYPALFIAMQEGHAETVKAHGELLKQFQSMIPEDQLIKLLAATNANGVPGIFIAMQEGHAEAVKAYGELLKQFEPIPEDQLIKLLAARDADNMPALFISMHEGHANAVKAYGDLVKLLPPDKQADLLLAKISHGHFKGLSGLQIALSNGHFRAAGELLQLLTQLVPNLSAEKRAMLQKELKKHEKTFRRHKAVNSSSLREWRRMKSSFSTLKAELSK